MYRKRGNKDELTGFGGLQPNFPIATLTDYPVFSVFQ
jgi:hypothetical protein